MRTAAMLFLAIAMASCSSVTHTSLRAPREQVGRWAFGRGINDTYGLWSPRVYGDGSVEEPFDTTWTSLLLNPTALAFNDTFLVVRNKNGRYMLSAKQLDGREICKSARSEKRYLALRAELGFPDSLVLRAIP